MTTAPITVLVCVGPEPKHSKYLDEAVESIWAQTVQPEQVLFIDDMSDLTQRQLPGLEKFCQEDNNPHDWFTFVTNRLNLYGTSVDLWKAPWNLGTVGAVNCGVALARHECVVILASDDLLHPWCLETCVNVYQPDKLAYYWFDIETFGKENDIQRIPSGASMVTKKLWKATGGYFHESAVGHSDSFLVGLMQTKLPVEFIPACPNGQNPPAMYKARLLDDNDRYIRLATGWDTIIDAVKNLAIDNWKAPQWGRFE